MNKALRQLARNQCIGQTFGLLTILGYSDKPFRWKARCVCGALTEPKWGNVAAGITTSCGCRSRARTKTHGLSSTPTYHSWQHMFQRCENTKNWKWKSYGGRGITVCPRWRKFENFLLDMGLKPVGTSLDRINNDGNYEPSNCRWATKVQQQNNTRYNRLLIWNKQTRTLSEWARYAHLTPKVIARRLQAGWTLDHTMTTPVKVYQR